MNNQTRTHSIYISPEVNFYLDCERTRLKGDSTGILTNDQVADGLLREVLTTRYPYLVLAFEQHCTVKSDSVKRYKELMEETVEKMGEKAL